MKRFKEFSKRTTALLIAAALLVAGGAVTGARAAFMAQSDLYRAQFYVNHLQVHLLENGRDVCGGENTLDNKETGALAASLGYGKEGDTVTLGAVDPGKAYREEIQAENRQNVPEYVRITVRKYWLKADGTKATDLSPALINFTFGAKDSDKADWMDYNDTDWVLGEFSTESATYYYRKPLDAESKTEFLFDKLRIDKAVMPDIHIATDEEIKDPTGPYADYVTVEETTEGKKIYTYSYKYDGYTFYIEADVQALQTHNAQDAIHSAWGVYNVTVGSDVNLSIQ